MAHPKIVLAVFNDPNFDQRMIRIAESLISAGYQVLLIGVLHPDSIPLTHRPFRQIRLSAFFRKGKARYFEFNLRLFFKLLFSPADLICAIDLDTIVPVYWVSRLRKISRVYDAHEWFSEMKEVVTRPGIFRIWKWVEKTYLPRFPNGYTVNREIAQQFKKLYGVDFEVVRNMPALTEQIPAGTKELFLIYQGAVNEGRAFEILLPAMRYVDYPLYIFGHGNFYTAALSLIRSHQLESKVFLKGKLLPEQLKKITPKALLGFTLFEQTGQSNILSLANRFFDYVMAGTPQICVDSPVYRELNNNDPVAVLIELSGPEALARQINDLLGDHEKYAQLHRNCLVKRLEWNWQRESETLLTFYQKIIPI